MNIPLDRFKINKYLKYQKKLLTLSQHNAIIIIDDLKSSRNEGRVDIDELRRTDEPHQRAWS